MLKKIWTLAALGLAMNTLSAQDVMTTDLMWDLNRVGGEVLSPDGKYVIYGVSKPSVSKDKSERNLFRIKLSNGEKEQISFSQGSEYAVMFRPDHDKMGYMYNGQWYESNADGTEEKQVSNEKGGIHFLKYSPDGKHVLYAKDVKMAKTKNDMHPDLPKAEARIIDDLMYRHWDSWSDDKNSHIFMSQYSDGRMFGFSADIMEGEKFDVPTMPFGGAEDAIWSPDSKSIIYVCKKTTGVDYAETTNTDLYQYSLRSGKTVNLTDGMFGYDNQPSFSPDGKYLSWTSMATAGYESDKNNIFIRDMKSGEMVNLTVNFNQTISSFVWGKDKSKIFFVAPLEGSYQYFELAVGDGVESPAKKNFKRISKGDFNYKTIHFNGNQLIGLRQDMNHASEVYSTHISSGKSTAISHENDAIYESIELSNIEKRWIKTSDGKDMLTWVIYPPGFDKNKKYPTLLYCQGGPQSMVSQFYSYRWNFQLMAAKGYIVVAPNRRGLPGFGEDWNKDISKDWGGQPMDDYLSAIDELAKESYVDENRLGAIGASYGGYSVYMLAGIHNKRFKTFISHCGLFNLESWYGTTEELFFANYDIGGPYWGDKKSDSYEKYSPHKYVDNWDTPILVIHGGNDFRVPINQGMEAFQVAKLKGLNSRFLYFPNEGHWILRPQNGLLWQREFYKWLSETL